MLAVYGGYTIYAQDEENPNFREAGLNFSEVFDAYHLEMNNYFNGKIAQLNTLLDQPNFSNKPEFKSPKVDPIKDNFEEIVLACENNVSTYCVSMGALDKYIDYVEVLNQLLTTLARDTSSTTTGDGYFDSLGNTLGYILTTTEQRNERIKKEFDSAKKVMEATIGAYHEYRLAYPLHKRYEKITTELIKYKLALKDIRKRAMEFPIRFIDSSSSQCE